MTDAPKLRKVYRFDNIKVDETYYTDEGFLIDHPIVTTVGIFEYMNPDGSIRRELRLPEEVFAPASLSTYEGKPIIITHDAGVVTKENVEQEIIGTILSKGYRDGENVRAKIVIHDTDRMKKSGLRELSLGYNLTLDETPGEWNGHHYDAIQRNIEINHLALVSAARAGENARLNIDGKEILTGGPEMEQNKTDGVLSPEELQKAVAEYLAKKQAAAMVGNDGDDDATANLPVSDGDDDVAVNNEPQLDEDDVIQSVKDRRDRRDAEDAPESKEAAMEVIAQQDSDIDALLKIIDKLKAQNDFNAANTDGDAEANDCGAIAKDGDGCATKTDGDESKSENLNLDSAAVDMLVAKKLDVIRVADCLNLDGVELMSVKDGKKTVINAVLPKLRLDGKSDDYIDALYDMSKQKVKERSGTSGQRRQMYNKDSATVAAPTTSAADEARKRMVERQNKNGGNK